MKTHEVALHAYIVTCVLLFPSICYVMIVILHSSVEFINVPDVHVTYVHSTTCCKHE